MAEPEFSATGVRIARWLRSLTRAGQIVVRDGRMVLMTSYGREIDSAPVEQVRVSEPWYAARGRALAAVNGTWYALRLKGQTSDGLVAALRGARARSSRAPGRPGTAKIAAERRPAPADG
ncbi:hypothetical protein IQ279_17185 [Streptomyces verrucosisporus]|uniref:hypothetical protein n=1 Tax=Streptomyces verrucosisporus TaxID=1695161 RepID=UPI0019D27ABC|nr:hypothetical protein [Streptomyces verrucosisporus]MBN3931342.1 hypothetical protein [Streptomyces verrucosisporus]